VAMLESYHDCFLKTKERARNEDMEKIRVLISETGSMVAV
jgi:hypothetical protein